MNLKIIDSRKIENKGEELEEKINKGLKKLGASGLITFIVDYNPKAPDIRKIKNQRMAFAVNKELLYSNLSDACRLLLLAKKQKWQKAGYPTSYIFPDRDESMQDFLAWVIKYPEDDYIHESEFLHNLFQRRKME